MYFGPWGTAVQHYFSSKLPAFYGCSDAQGKQTSLAHWLSPPRPTAVFFYELNVAIDGPLETHIAKVCWVTFYKKRKLSGDSIILKFP